MFAAPALRGLENTLKNGRNNGGNRAVELTDRPDWPVTRFRPQDLLRRVMTRKFHNAAHRSSRNRKLAESIAKYQPAVVASISSSMSRKICCSVRNSDNCLAWCVRIRHYFNLLLVYYVQGKLALAFSGGEVNRAASRSRGRARLNSAAMAVEFITSVEPLSACARERESV